MLLDQLLYMHHMGCMSMDADLQIAEAAVVTEVVNECLLTRTRQISRVITNLYDHAMRPHGLNSPQFSLMVTIAKLRGASRAEIGRANHQERSTLTRNLALMLEAGWVEELPAEGRSRPIVLSEGGRKLLVTAAPAWRAAQEEARKLLGTEGAAALIAMADSLPPSLGAD
jgi:DNA-binding MarR family transcriptional regulator